MIDGMHAGRDLQSVDYVDSSGSRAFEALHLGWEVLHDMSRP